MKYLQTSRMKSESLFLIKKRVYEHQYKAFENKAKKTSPIPASQF